MHCNASKATPGSTIRLRLDLVFGSPSTYPYPPTLVIVRCTETKSCLKSISSHRNASSSPRLIPVVNMPKSATRQGVNHAPPLVTLLSLFNRQRMRVIPQFSVSMRFQRRATIPSGPSRTHARSGRARPFSPTAREIKLLANSSATPPIRRCQRTDQLPTPGTTGTPQRGCRTAIPPPQWPQRDTHTTRGIPKKDALARSPARAAHARYRHRQQGRHLGSLQYPTPLPTRPLFLHEQAHPLK